MSANAGLPCSAFLQSIKSMCKLGNLQLPTCMSDANLDELTEMP